MKHANDARLPVSLVEQAQTYASQSRAANTMKAYAADWEHFQTWCKHRDAAALPASPGTVALYLTDLAATLKVSTLQRRLVSIRQVHLRAGYELDMRNPALKETWSGIKRAHGTAQTGKAPVMLQDLRDMLQQTPDSLIGTRDRALLLLGFAGAFRRSELVGLDIDQLDTGTGHVEITNDGLVVHLAWSKTDQDGAGRQVGIPYGSNPDTCPVRAVQAWRDAAGIDAGPLFRPINRHGQLRDRRLTDRSVALIVKKYAQAAAVVRGADPATALAYADKFAGHSLRAGFATSAATAGVSERSIMAQTGHKRVDTLRKYIRMGSLFTENAAGQVGL